MKLPTYLQLEPVGQCNLRCQMCPIQFRHDGPPHGPPAFMAFDLFTRLIDENPNLQTLHLQGLGEPLMHPRFFEMVAYAVARGVRVTTNSNLTLLNARKAHACVESGLDCLHVSVDGATPETYESIRIRGHFERVLANIRLVNDAKVRNGAATPRLHLVTVGMRRNLAELPALVRLAAELDVEEVFVQHLCHDFAEPSLPSGYLPMRAFIESETLLNAPIEEIDASFTAARDAAAAAGIRLRLPPVREQKHATGTPGRERCDWPWSGGYVSYDGSAMPCCMVSTPDRINFGNAGSDGFAPIWQGEQYEAFRAALAEGPPPEVCASCSLYHGTF